MNTVEKNYLHGDMVIKRIRDKCAPYIKNDQYVYKNCYCNIIVVLKKTDKTITNESRKSVINPKYAKFRGNRFEVVCMFKVFDCDYEYVRAPSCYNNDFYYEKNCIVEVENFDPDIEHVHSTGIHYFKDVLAAYFYDLDLIDVSSPIDFSGQWILYYDDGRKMVDFNYVNGKLEGKCKKWYNNGQISCDRNYVNGKLEGNCIQWHSNGKMRTKKNYTDFILNGECTEWNESGQIINKQNYVNGIPYFTAS